MLLNELRDFLGSVKTSESLSQELRSKITVETGLERALAVALKNGKNVIIAGSAGGGKTHLIGELSSSVKYNVAKFITWPSEPEPADEEFVRVVTDTTALTPDSRQKILENRPHNCVAVAVAINEGPLLSLAHSMPESHFASAVKLLHSAQRGIEVEYDDELPTVLDVGGYDPIENNVVTKLLGLPILVELVESTTCLCANPELCFRRRAWKWLQSDMVRQRVNDLLRVVNMLGQPVLFRELWDFVADLVLGGSCQDEIPTSPWFWRVFYGSSTLSARLRNVADPSLVVYPRAESHIWYGDWNSSELELHEGTELLELVSERPFSPEAYRWLKSQIFFLVRSSSTTQVLRDLVDLQLSKALEQDDVLNIVAAINHYMTYGTVHPSQTALQLWTDLAVERRTDRPYGEVSLGTVQAADLCLRRSQAVTNHPDSECKVNGARFFLVHRKSISHTDASFSLSPEVLNLLRGGRSYRASDRPHTDMEWHISRFFSALAMSESNPRQLDVMEVDFKTMSGRIGSYRVSRELCQIEPLGRS